MPKGETFGLDIDFGEALERFARVKRPELEKDTGAENAAPDTKNDESNGVSKKP